MLASRWRFTFFERWHDTLKKFDSSRSDAEFLDECRQLEYNKEWIENEGVELGADDIDAMVQAFFIEHKARVERFYFDFYDDAKEKMKSRLPPTLEGLTQQMRSEVQAAIIESEHRISQAVHSNLCSQDLAPILAKRRPQRAVIAVE
jgi:hypothetical protein